MTAMAPAYPIRVDVDPPAQQNRLSVLLRIIFIIPAAIVVSVIGVVAAVIYFIAWFAILFTGSYPQGLLKFSAGSLRWGMRVLGYFYLLTDKYPPFSLEPDENYPVRIAIDERVSGRNRLTTFWPIRWLLALPHLIIVQVLGYAAAVVGLIGWVAAIFTGSLPVGLHNFLVGYLRWYARANGYMLDLVDEYPPFGLS